MKKNYIKKLALTMAFAMVFTSVAPTSTASAASKPALNASSKTLLLNGTGSYDFNIKNAVKGSTYKWTSSNKAVATVNSKGIVKAVATGTSKVTVSIKTKAGKTIKLTAAVTVKENASSLKIDSVSNSAIKVGEAVTLKATSTTKTGKATTDITRWEVTTGKDNASITDDGVFTAKAAGEYKVVARTFQSKTKYNEFLNGKTTNATATAEAVTVKVVTTITGVKLVSTKQLEITFDSSVKDIVKAKTDVTVSRKLTGDNTAMVPVFTFDSISADGKTVKVSTYDSLVNKETYIIAAANSKIELLAQIGAPVSISMENQVIPANTSTQVKYTLLDQYGVDVSSVYDKDVVKSSSVPFDAGKLGWLTLGDKAVSFVDYSYTIFNSADGTFKTISTGTKSVTGALATVGSTLEWNIGSSDFSKNVQTVVAGDTSKTIYGRAKKSDGTYTASSAYKFISLNESILVIDGNTNALQPITAGTALVQVVDRADNSKVIAYINVNVLAKSATASVKASAQQVVLSNSINGAPETATVTLKNVDQYGNETNTAIKESYVLTSTKTTDIATISTSGNAITFTAVTGKTGSFNYYVKTSEDKVVTLTITVAAPGSLTGYVINADQTSIDAYAANADTESQVAFKVYGVDSAQVKKELVIANPTTGPAITYTVTKPDGSTAKVLTDSNSDGTVEFSVNDVVGSGADVAGDVAVGNYTLTVSIGGIKYSKTFEVKNTRKVPTLTVAALSTEVATGSAISGAAVKVFTIKIGDTTLTASDISSVEFYSSDSSIIANNGTHFSSVTGTVSLYVTKVKVVNAGVVQEITVNQSVKVTVK